MISTELRPDQLDDEQKNWFAIAICEAIIADGDVALEELLYLEKALSFLPSTKQVAALIQAVKDQKLPPLAPLNEASRDTQIRMLFELVQVISSDNVMSSREMDYLVVMRWANEGIMWRNKLKYLLKVGAELEPEYE